MNTKNQEVIPHEDKSLANLFHKNMNQPPDEQPLAIISRLCQNKDLDVAVLNSLVDLQIKTQEHQAKIDYAFAMTKFAGLKKPIKHNQKGKTAGNTPFTYADYPAMVTAVDPWMKECGLSHSHKQEPPIIESGNVVLIMVTCIIKHTGGHSESYPYPAVPDERLRGKVSPSQLIQLAITYAKRQTLAEGLGLATSEDTFDDDSKAPPGLITEEQEADLNSLIDEVDANKVQFLKMLKVEKLSDLPAANYNGAVKRLQDKAKS